MRTSSTFLFYATLLLLSTFAAAWPWPRFLPAIDSLIVRRADGGSDPTTAHETKSTAEPTASASDSKETSSHAMTSKPTETGSKSAKASDSESGSESGSKKSGSSNTKSKATSTKKHSSFDPRLPAGGLSLITPAATIAFPVFKIGANVTFEFTYTSLKVTPTALNIMATCTGNKEMYTIAMNQTIKAKANGEVYWDTDGYETKTAPLVMETYTLIIYDADGSATDTPEAGYLAPFNSKFGLYASEHYEAGDGIIRCATCSGAFGSMERSALGFAVGMSVLTVLTFGWFVNGLDVIW